MTFARNLNWADDVQNLKIVFHAWYEPSLDKTLKYYDITWLL